MTDSTPNAKEIALKEQDFLEPNRKKVLPGGEVSKKGKSSARGRGKLHGKNHHGKRGKLKNMQRKHDMMARGGLAGKSTHSQSQSQSQSAGGEAG